MSEGRARFKRKTVLSPSILLLLYSLLSPSLVPPKCALTSGHVGRDELSGLLGVGKALFGRWSERGEKEEKVSDDGKALGIEGAAAKNERLKIDSLSPLLSPRAQSPSSPRAPRSAWS